MANEKFLLASMYNKDPKKVPTNPPRQPCNNNIKNNTPLKSQINVEKLMLGFVNPRDHSGKMRATTKTQGSHLMLLVPYRDIRVICHPEHDNHSHLSLTRKSTLGQMWQVLQFALFSANSSFFQQNKRTPI